MSRTFKVVGVLGGVLVIFIGLIVMKDQKANGANEKIGFVDVATVFDGYEKTKENDQILREMGKKKEEERDALVHEIRRLKDEIALLSEEAAAEKRKMLDEKVRELEEFDTETKRTLGKKRNEVVRDIFKDIDKVVQRYGERKGYDMIFNQRVLLYGDAHFDITQEILKELNQQYQRK